MDRLEIAGPGFLNVFLSPAWCADALREVLAAGDEYGRSDAARVLLEFVSANPTGPLVIVNARGAGDALAPSGIRGRVAVLRQRRGQPVSAVARSVDVRLRQALRSCPRTHTGEYLDLVAWLARDPPEIACGSTR